jgi:hypothetical protein
MEILTQRVVGCGHNGADIPLVQDIGLMQERILASSVDGGIKWPVVPPSRKFPSDRGCAHLQHQRHR